jgi:3-oxoacyl-[acyl-carrier protein] reductase
MNLTFSVSRALVTGAARGIGAAIAERLAGAGLAVALVDLDEAQVTQTAKEIAERTDGRTVPLVCDVSNRTAVTAMVEDAVTQLGGLDTLVTNAGITRDGFLHKMSDEAWDAVIGVHLTGTFACLRAAAPHLRGDGPGRVVCVSSVSGATGNLGQANYTAAKGGIVSLAKTAARELARAETTVNVVRPGFVETPMTAAMPEDARTALVAQIPLGRPGQPADIAGVVAFLCSDEASFMTGAVLDINGGFYM